MEKDLISVVKSHFDLTMDMIGSLIDTCPQPVWQNPETEVWKHVFHAICGIEFWFRKEGTKFTEPVIRKDVTPDFSKHTNDYATKDEMLAYFEKNKKIAEDFFNGLREESLSNAADVYNKITQLDVILMQIRHIQHHIGYCNSVMKAYGATPVKWVDKF